jgi:Na+/proline symporter
MRYVVVIAAFWVFAGLAYAVMEWAVPAIYSGSPSAPSGFNYGTSFVVPFSHAFGPWIAGIIVVLGPVVALRAAIDRYAHRRGVSANRRQP